MSISPTYCTFITPQNNQYGWRQDLETKIREDFTITEKAPKGWADGSLAQCPNRFFIKYS
jgi:hypothetical protein